MIKSPHVRSSLLNARLQTGGHSSGNPKKIYSEKSSRTYQELLNVHCELRNANINHWEIWIIILPSDNEQIKTSFSKMKETFLKLFNIILNTGCFPESWAEGLIVPIYKMKGSKNDPNNYRGITLLSCLAKFFNICLNNRLKIVSEKILSAIQAGFRPGFSTMDHIFTLLCILTLYERLQKNLFIAFIDYQKAFDTVWRAGLWL